MITELLFKVERWEKQYPGEHRVAVYAVDPEWMPNARLMADCRATPNDLSLARGLLELLVPLFFPDCRLVWAGEAVPAEEIPKEIRRAVKALAPFLKRKE